MEDAMKQQEGKREMADRDRIVLEERYNKLIAVSEPHLTATLAPHLMGRRGPRPAGPAGARASHGATLRVRVEIMGSQQM
jgi:hypothetical protein